MTTPPRPALFWVLLVLLTAEAVFIGLLAVTLIFEVLTAPADSPASGIALAVLAVLATGWMVAMVVGALRGQAWIRGSAIVWQILQLAVGIGALQGAVAQPAWGVPLIVVSGVTLLLLFVPSVVAATSRRDPRS